MIIARFQFKPGGVADQFVDRAGQTVVETLWDDVIDLVEFCKEIEDILEDCVVLTGDGIIQLSAQQIG